MGLPPDEAVVAGALRPVEAFLDVADRELRGREFMAGNEFGLWDVFHVQLVQRLCVCRFGDFVLSREGVSAWWDRVSNRPAMEKLLAADKEA